MATVTLTVTIVDTAGGLSDTKTATFEVQDRAAVFHDNPPEDFPS